MNARKMYSTAYEILLKHNRINTFIKITKRSVKSSLNFYLHLLKRNLYASRISIAQVENQYNYLPNSIKTILHLKRILKETENELQSHKVRQEMLEKMKTLYQDLEAFCAFTLNSTGAC